MIDVKQEAEQYLKKIDEESGTTWTEDNEEIVKAFVDFTTNSKYVQAKILQEKIKFINTLILENHSDTFWTLENNRLDFQLQLKYLENDNTNP